MSIKKIFPLLLLLNLMVYPQGTGMGTRIDLTENLQLSSGQFAQLFIPDYYNAPADGKFTLVFHFHSASWAAEDIIYKAQTNALLFNIHLGALSSPYQNFFTNPSKFQTILDTIISVIKNRNLIAEPVIDKLILTSFSAGYAGVREIIKNYIYYNKINGLILGDGLHSSSDPGAMATQLSNFVKFAADARDLKKIFLLTHSSITTTGYQSTTQTSDYLLSNLGEHREFLTAFDEVGTQYSKCETGNFHLKGYEGITADDHMKHLYGMHLMLKDLIEIMSAPTWVDESYLTPEDYWLYQNYPNPFNPVTNIKFSIPETAFVSIDIFNFIGEKIVNILNEEKSQGTYNIKFDASELTSGVYLFRMTAGDFAGFRKMIVMK